ncbi:MAG: taurine dioxygenase [Betaproteobacteria bacterium]|nr:Alpha-ketoglutarate-dependent taurine dioxygenase [Rhodocyclaceae bacterium]
MAIKVRKLSYGLGASITGVDLRSPLDDATMADVRKAWLDHLVVVFPDQVLTPEQQIAFGKRFGPLDDHQAAPFYRHPEYPEIYLITNHKIGGRPSETKDTGRMWHSDHSFTTRPTMATMLYCREIPSVGGDTMLTNMYMAYESLSDAMKTVLDRLEAVHDVANYHANNPYFRDRDTGQLTEMKKLSPPVAQPVVRVHPETGRKALFVNEGTTTQFVGMTSEESRALLEFLFEHSVRPEFTYRHAWKVNDLLMWDNRCTMHKALADYTHDQPRHMHRLTVLGTPCGRSYEGDTPPR